MGLINKIGLGTVQFGLNYGISNIKGKTESITFEVVKNGTIYTTKLEIDRSKYDVRYGSTSFFDSLGDKAIDDIFTLKINLITV